MLLVVCRSCFADGIYIVTMLGLLFNGNSHELVSGSLLPLIITCLFLITFISVFVNMTLQSALHSTGAEIRNLFISLKICPFFGFDW